MPQGQSAIKERQRTDLKEPRRFKVIMHNDDFTTMEFVVRILKEIFFMSEEKAITVTMQIHKTDKGVAGVYTYDIAMSKMRKATRLARENNFPLRLTVEPDDE